MFFGAVIIQHWKLFHLDSLLRCVEKVPEKSSPEMVVTFMVMNIPLHHPFLESPTKQIQAIHFCGFQAIHFKSKLSILCGFRVKCSMDFLQPGRRTLLSELSPTGRQCRPHAPQDIAQDWFFKRSYSIDLAKI